jgi:hypothetical protein
MARMRIIAGRWYSQRREAWNAYFCAVNRELRLIQLLLSSTGGGGPPLPRRASLASAV